MLPEQFSVTSTLVICFRLVITGSSFSGVGRVKNRWNYESREPQVRPAFFPRQRQPFQSSFVFFCWTSVFLWDLNANT